MKNQMRYRTKKDVIEDMSSKKCWDIKRELAIEATQDIDDGRFYIYSAMHYKIVYNIIQAKLSTIKDPILRIGYIDCLMMNYNDLGSERINSALDIICGIASGSILGLSLKDLSLGKKEVVIIAAMLFAFHVLKATNLLFRKWNFYNLVLQQIKDEMCK